MRKFLVFICALTMVFGMVVSANAATMITDLQDIWAIGGITIDLPGSDSDTFTSISDPFGGQIGFSPAVQHRTVGSTWATWSTTYGDPAGLEILYSSASFLAVDFAPGGVYAFGFELEPNPFDVFTFYLGLSDGSIQTQDVSGSAGALTFGFTEGDVSWMAVHGGSDFAIGRLTMLKSVPEPATMFLLGFGLLGLGLARRKS